MGRPATGSRRQRGSCWLGSVPRLCDPTKRVEASFPTKTAREAWITEQLVRRAQGFEPEPPRNRARAATRRPAGVAAPAPGAVVSGPSGTVVPVAALGAHDTADAHAAAPTFEAVARAWHAERYSEMHQAGAEREADVLADLERHLFGARNLPLPEAREALSTLYRQGKGAETLG